MLYAVLNHLRNFFPKERIVGSFTVNEGVLQLPLKDGQYFLISEKDTDSALNIGVHRYPAELQDETFKGDILVMAIPPGLVKLAEDIQAYTEKNADVIDSPYQSESFNGYSYNKGDNGKSARWQNVFKERLDTWRKI